LIGCTPAALRCSAQNLIGGERKSGMTVAFHRFDNSKRRRPEGDERQRYRTPLYVFEPVRRLRVDAEPIADLGVTARPMVRQFVLFR
jgi:hypothetical protein